VVEEAARTADGEPPVDPMGQEDLWDEDEGLPPLGEGSIEQTAVLRRPVFALEKNPSASRPVRRPGGLERGRRRRSADGEEPRPDETIDRAAGQADLGFRKGAFDGKEAAQRGDLAWRTALHAFDVGQHFGKGRGEGDPARRRGSAGGTGKRSIEEDSKRRTGVAADSGAEVEQVGRVGGSRSYLEDRLQGLGLRTLRADGHGDAPHLLPGKAKSHTMADGGLGGKLVAEDEVERGLDGDGKGDR